MGVIKKIVTGKLFSNLLRLFLYFLFIFYLGKNVQKSQKKGRFWAKSPKDVSTDGNMLKEQNCQNRLGHKALTLACGEILQYQTKKIFELTPLILCCSVTKKLRPLDVISTWYLTKLCSISETQYTFITLAKDGGFAANFAHFGLNSGKVGIPDWSSLYSIILNWLD